MKFLILLLVLLAGPAYAETEFMSFSCGPYLDDEMNYRYSFTYEQFREMKKRDLADITLYLAVRGNMNFNLNPNMTLDNCDKVLPEKYKVKK